MARHMCEEESFADVRKACRLAEIGHELDLYGLKIPLRPGKRDPNYIHRIAYDRNETHQKNVIMWLNFWSAQRQAESFHVVNSTFPLINASLQTCKLDLKREVEFFHVDAEGRILLGSGMARGAQFCHIVSEIFHEEKELPNRTKLLIIQEYLRGVISAVINAARREDLDYFARGMIFVVMKGGEPYVNVIDGSFDLFKLSGLLDRGRLGGQGMKGLIDCFDARVKEEQKRQSELISSFVFDPTKSRRAGKSMAPLFAHQHQILGRVMRANKNTTTTVIQGLGKA